MPISKPKLISAVTIVALGGTAAVALGSGAAEPTTVAAPQAEVRTQVIETTIHKTQRLNAQGATVTAKARAARPLAPSSGTQSVSPSNPSVATTSSQPLTTQSSGGPTYEQVATPPQQGATPLQTRSSSGGSSQGYQGSGKLLGPPSVQDGGDDDSTQPSRGSEDDGEDHTFGDDGGDTVAPNPAPATRPTDHPAQEQDDD